MPSIKMRLLNKVSKKRSVCHWIRRVGPRINQDKMIRCQKYWETRKTIVIEMGHGIFKKVNC